MARMIEQVEFYECKGAVFEGIEAREALADALDVRGRDDLQGILQEIQSHAGRKAPGGCGLDDVLILRALRLFDGGA